MHLEHGHIVLIVLLTVIIAAVTAATIILRFIFPSSKKIKEIKSDKDRFDVGTWLRASMEETPGRASGKAISAFIIIILFVMTTVYVITYDKLWGKDFEMRQSDLIGTAMNSMVILILSLYGVKAMMASKWFSGNNGNNGNGNGYPPPPPQYNNPVQGVPGTENINIENNQPQVVVVKPNPFGDA